MGAHEYIIGYREADEAKVKKLWEAQVEEDGYDSGTGAYAGNATTMHGRIRFRDKRFATENEARDWLLKEHEKREAPMAASFYIPAEVGENDKKRVVKAEDKLHAAWDKQYELVRKVGIAFVNRKSKFVSCNNCGSRLSLEHLKPQIVKGSPNFREYMFGPTLPTIPACPVCKAALVSETDLKRIKSHEAKIEQAQAALQAAQKPKASKKLGWCVGGWAAS